MNLLDYLDQHLVPRAALMRAAALDDDGLAQLQARGMAPLPSYRLALDLRCDSFFGKHEEHVAREYFATGCAAWIESVRASGEPPQQLFRHRYRARLAQLAAAGFATGDPTLNAGLEQHLLEEWRYFLDGTYGLCTRTGTPEDIAAKELAVTIIKELIAGERALTHQERDSLSRAVDLLDAASAPFAPHELVRSSRQRLVNDVRAAYFSASENCLR